MIKKNYSLLKERNNFELTKLKKYNINNFEEINNC